MNTVAKMPISGYHTTREIDCSQVSFQIKPYRSQNSSVVSIDVLAVPDLNMTPVKTSELHKLCSKFDHLKHITFPNVKQNQVCIIIGIDNLDLIHFNEIVKGPKNTPWAVKTPLGWTCAGKTNIIADEQNLVLKTQICSHGQLDNELFTKVQDWMEIENYGIASKEKHCPRTMKRLWKFYNPQPDSRMVITKLVSCGKRTQNCRITDGSLRNS